MRQCIFKVHKREAPYVIMDKNFLQKENLTMQAKGLLAYLLSLPNDWVIYRKELVTRFKNGEKALLTTIKELEQDGYIKKKQMRDSKCRFGGVSYSVFEIPKLENVENILKPESPKPRGRKRHSGKRSGGKDALLSNNSNKEKINKQTNIGFQNILRKYGWTGQIDSLIEMAGSIEAAICFWEKTLEPIIENITPKLRGGFITNRFKKDAKDYWECYKTELAKSEKIKKSKKDFEEAKAYEEKLEEEKYLQRINDGKARWGAMPKQERIRYAEKVKNEYSFLSGDIDVSTGTLPDDSLKTQILYQLGEE